MLEPVPVIGSFQCTLCLVWTNVNNCGDRDSYQAWKIALKLVLAVITAPLIAISVTEGHVVYLKSSV